MKNKHIKQEKEKKKKKKKKREKIFDRLVPRYVYSKSEFLASSDVDAHEIVLACKPQNYFSLCHFCRLWPRLSDSSSLYRRGHHQFSRCDVIPTRQKLMYYLASTIHYMYDKAPFTKIVAVFG